MTNKLIGGFKELFTEDSELFDTDIDNSVWSYWSANAIDSVCRVNARSCISYLLKVFKIRRLFIPSYFCKSVDCLSSYVDIIVYPINQDLSVDFSRVQHKLKSGDAFLFVNYFGMQMNTNILKFKKLFPEVLFIEDSSHSLTIGKPVGDWLVYSPRKVLGVIDSGISFCFNNNWRLASEEGHVKFLRNSELELLSMARIQRKLNPLANKKWFDKYLAAESWMPCDSKLMCSHETIHTLKKVNVTFLIKRQISNQLYLYENLNSKYKSILDISLAKNSVLIGFPVQSKSKALLLSLLVKNDIFCAQLWGELSKFSHAGLVEQTLKNELFFLPCDYRYGVDDMKKICDLLNPLVGHYE